MKKLDLEKYALCALVATCGLYASAVYATSPAMGWVALFVAAAICWPRKNNL